MIKKNTHSVAGTTEQAAGIGLTVQVPKDDYTTAHLKKRSLFAGVAA